MTNHRHHLRGESHPNARHPDSVVREARRLHKQGLGYRRIGRRMGIKPHTVYQWLVGITRAEV